MFSSRTPGSARTANDPDDGPQPTHRSGRERRVARLPLSTERQSVSLPQFDYKLRARAVRRTIGKVGVPALSSGRLHRGTRKLRKRQPQAGKERRERLVLRLDKPLFDSQVGVATSGSQRPVLALAPIRILTRERASHATSGSEPRETRDRVIGSLSAG